MTVKRLTLNGITGILLTVLAAATYYWTYSMRLRPMELFVPRISLVLIMIGGILVLLKELIKPEKTDMLSKAWILPYAIGVSIAMWLYGWAFRNIGLITSTFLFLSIWWIWVAYRDARRKGSFASFRPTIIKMMGLAIIVSVVVQLLFINLLGMYMPRTFFP